MTSNDTSARVEATVTTDDVPLLIESLDLDANGVTHRDGKVVFVRGALAGERVRVRTVRRKPRFDVAEIAEVLRPASARERPGCPHFGVCGGCSMQHLAPRSQVAIKQRAVEDALWHVGRLRPETVLRPIAGPAWGYRYRARLSVRHVAKKGGVLVGFHERGSSYVADMTECHVLPPRVSDLLPKLRELVGGLSIRDRLPQIEVAIGADMAQGAEGPDDAVLALVLRVLEAPTPDDEARLRAFAATHGLELWLQPKGPDTIRLFASGLPPRADAEGGAPRFEGFDGSRLGYALAEFGVAMPYRPTDFTQVNHRINAVLVGRALRLLDPQPGERVVDLFCGLGNFTLPLATRASEVVGIEGSATLVARARDNARANGLADRADFAVENLFEFAPERWRALNTPRAVDRLLVDPPREGALAVAQVLSRPDAPRPRRIVYVSCNPATLARDCAILVHEGGWRLVAAGAVNMFPHTSHVESIVVLEPGPVPTAPVAEEAADPPAIAQD